LLVLGTVLLVLDQQHLSDPVFVDFTVRRNFWIQILLIFDANMKSKSMSGVVYRYSNGTQSLWACIGYNRCVQCHAVWLHTQIQNDHNCHFLCASHKHDMCMDLVSTIYVNHTTAVL
jgi:hypothetical protein